VNTGLTTPKNVTAGRTKPLCVTSKPLNFFQNVIIFFSTTECTPQAEASFCLVLPDFS